MKKLNKLIALTSMLALLTAQVEGQEYYDDNSAAYNESGTASYMSALLPIGALVVAGIIIATTDRSHHHSSSSGSSIKQSSSSSSSASSISHGHFSSSSSSSGF